MDSVCSRYYGVQFQGKVGVLLINAEKVIFRPKLEAHAPEGTKPATRSWRWVAIERIEVLDGPRGGGGASLRGIKLKSKTAGGKGVTLKVPQDILNEVLQDMNRRLSGDALGIEGAVETSSGLAAKPAVTRRKTMSDAKPSEPSSPAQIPRQRPTAQRPTAQRPNAQTMKSHVRRPAGARRGSMPNSAGRRASMPSLRAQDSIPEQVEVADWTMDQSDPLPRASGHSIASESSRSRDGFLNKVGQKLKKSPLLKPQERRNSQPINTESKRPLLKVGRRLSLDEEASRHSQQSTTSTKNSNAPKQRQMLEFMKPPPPRRNITAEMAEMEKKVQEQLARRKAMHQKTMERRRKMDDVKRRHSLQKVGRADSASNMSNSSSHNNISTPPQRSKGRVRTATRRRSQEAMTRDLVFDSIIKEDVDHTSTTENSTPESSPKEMLEDEKHTGTLWNPNAPDNKFKMMILQHAATCEEKKGTCPYDPICTDHKKVLQHIETCQNDDCGVDKCTSTRNFLLTMRLMMNDNAKDDKTTREFLVGMGAIAPVPVIDIGHQSNQHEWDAFSAVSSGTWFDHGH